MSFPAVFSFDPLASLVATVEVLGHIAEDAVDTQATREDPEQAAWLAGYRQACKDVLDARAIQQAAHPTTERRTS